MGRGSLDGSALDPDLTYDEFRTGLTYKQVYHMIWDRRWKRRRGVLGYWHQLKLEMFAEYQRRLAEVHRGRRSRSGGAVRAKRRRAA
jgi:hypothetical protein